MKQQDAKSKSIVVAQYLRMSTEHQKYSIENQEGYLHKYANEHNMSIDYTYSDSGKSGVTISGRNGLKQLIWDITNQHINVKAVLVYDVSRFGRFQDPDEAGYYSFLIKKCGVKIIYCSAPLPDEYPEVSMFALPLMRYDAAYHSKNLSEKVFLGQINLVKRGYHQGGTCGYGLRRLLIDEYRNEKGILCHNQRKSIQSDRVILVPGPKNEIKIVNMIYDFFIFKNMPEYLISNYLNRNNISAENQSLWTRSALLNKSDFG